jgi:poly(3-hydroxybutyrate) depolymerase
MVALMVVAMVGSACSGGGDSEAQPGAHSVSDTNGRSTTSSTRSTTPGPEVLPAVEPKATTIAATLRTPDGRDRTYHVYVPSTLATGGSASARVPLVVALHGGLGVDDVTFIRMLIEHLRTQHPIDPARIFAAGHSNGGMLAYRLACELADTIVAVGVQSAALEVDGCQPAQPVSLLHIHGTADENVPINGGTGPNAVSGVSFRPPRAGAKAIATGSGCPPNPRRSTEVTNRDISIDTWGPCPDGTEVRFMTIDGAPHAWMGAPANAQRRGVPSYAGLDASAVIWKFLITNPRTS